MDQKKRKVFLIADSRGRDLEKRLNNYNSHIQFCVKVHPGASISWLIAKTHQLLGSNDGKMYSLAVVFGGICDITKISYMPYRAAIPRMETASELIENFKSSCEGANIFIPNIPILLTPIVGIDLIQYAGHWDESLFGMQPMIDDVVPVVNSFIKSHNRDRGLPTPNKASCIHRCRGKNKGHRTHYQKLYDGCHPTEEVKENWAKAISECCKLILE